MSALTRRSSPSPGSLSIPEVAVLLALAGAGMGPMYPATTVIIQNCVLPHQFGIATGSLNFFRSLGGAIIVAVFSAIVIGGLDRAGTGSAADDQRSSARSGQEPLPGHGTIPRQELPLGTQQT